MEVDKDLAEEFKYLTQDDSEFIKKCSKFAEEISSGQMTIVGLVEQLGRLLVDPTPSNRELGTWILTRVLETLPPKHFDNAQLKYLCNFYKDRLKDHHQVIPAVLGGILTLCKFENFPTESASEFLIILFTNISCQQQQERDRFNIYKIFEVFLDKFWTKLSDMGQDLVYGVISAVDGERNPKNLIFLFNWFPKFFKKIRLGPLTEEAFEVLACYFPVDFKAPTNETNSITREQLAAALAPCLTAIPDFSELCLELVLEKFDSSLEIAKLDSLHLLETSCLTFDVSCYVNHVTILWPLIEKEVFQTTNPEIEQACLKTLTAVMKKISDDPILQTTVKNIADTLKGNLFPDSKLFQPSTKLLLSVALASSNAANLITKEIAPILINMYNIVTIPTQKISILRVSAELFKIYTRFHKISDCGEVSQVPILCLKASRDHGDISQVAFYCLSDISGKLPENIRILVYDNLKKMMEVSQDKAILKCLESLAEKYPEEVNSHLLGNTETYNQFYLDALCTLVHLDFFTEIIIDKILSYMIKDLNSVIVFLEKILIKHENHYRIYKMLNKRNVISLLIESALTNNINDVTFEKISFILKTLISKMSRDEQIEIIQKELPKTKNNIFLLDGILSHVRRDVEINYDILNDLNEVVNSDRKNIVVQLIANIINKCQDENVIQYLGQFNDKNPDLVLMAWITKALVMRNHQMANIWTDKLIGCLNTDENAANCFRIVMNNNYDCLSTKSYANITFLYQQKFFTIVSNKLCDNFRPEMTSYLIAIGYLLEFAPKQAILLQFKKLLKMIILCLDQCNESEILIIILQQIKDFIIAKEKCIEENLSDFLSRFLKLTSYENSMKVRILALHCLQEVTIFPLYQLLPHKNEVLLILGKILDDKKRIVRREAVETRLVWFLLDAPL